MTVVVKLFYFATALFNVRKDFRNYSAQDESFADESV